MTRNFRFDSDYRIRDYLRSEESHLPPRNPLREHPVTRWAREDDLRAAREELRRREVERREEGERERRERRREQEEREENERRQREEFWEQERIEEQARRDREHLEYLFCVATEKDAAKPEGGEIP